MDKKSAFLDGVIKEEFYLKQTKGFEDLNFLNHVMRLKKALYDLKQAPNAWYEDIIMFLHNNGFLEKAVTKHFSHQKYR